MLFVALTKEPQEDEYIMTERANAIILSAYIYLLLFIGMVILHSLNALWKFIPHQSYYKLLLFNNPLPIFVLYIAIFRIKMFRMRRALRHAE